MVALEEYEALRNQPQGRPAMYQRWRNLLFLHSRHDPNEIQKLLPPGLEIDTFDGSAWVGLVPFRMEGVRPVGFPGVPGLSVFPETNVRTYAHFNGVPGVWFFSLDAGNATACKIARWFFGLPYHFAQMSVCEGDNRIEYRQSRRGTAVRSQIVCRPGTEIAAPKPGSLEFFLVERYLLFTLRNGKLYSGRVHHPPYPLRTAGVESLEESLVQAAGIVPRGFEHVVYSPGVDVRVFRLAELGP